MADWYCPLPFKHAYVDSTGIAPCCQILRQPVALDTWANNPTLKQIQSDILRGQRPAACEPCQQQESARAHSLRLSSIEDYQNQRFVETQIDFVDYRSSNICNFKCRTCRPESSHGIAQEFRQHPELRPFAWLVDGKTVSVDQPNRDWIIANLPKLRRLMFTGGEPTVIPEVRSILESVLDNPPPDLNILITTNGSFTDQFWYDLTQQHKNLHWTVSVDAVGSAAEIVRHGTEWATVAHNLDWLSQHAGSMDINTVISNLNVLHLEPLLTYVRDLQLQSQRSGQMGDQGLRHLFYVCVRPYELAADNWPLDLRSRVLRHLQQCLALDLDTHQQQTVENLMNSVLFAQFDQSLWDRSQEYNQILDRIRNQNHNVLHQTV